jgi:hypothetical protein
MQGGVVVDQAKIAMILDMLAPTLVRELHHIGTHMVL